MRTTLLALAAVCLLAAPAFADPQAPAKPAELTTAELKTQVTLLQTQLAQAAAEGQALRQQRISADDREGAILAQIIKAQMAAQAAPSTPPAAAK